jgi:hypothetical protein
MEKGIIISNSSEQWKSNLTQALYAHMNKKIKINIKKKE